MLSLEGLHKRFGKLHAVDDVTLRVNEGEVFGLLGPNGAGKTTTIGIAIGLIRPDAGRVIIDDAGPPTYTKARALLGVAPQSLAVYDELTGEENLFFFGRLHAVPRRQLAPRVNDLLKLTALTDRGRARVSTYSGGMKRRLNLAAALIHDPPIILLDEPTAGVDPQSRTAILEIISALRDRGRAILYTTHYMEEAEKLCDRVGIIDHGRLLAMGPVQSLIETHGGDSVITVHRNHHEQRFPTRDPASSIAAILSEGDVSNVRIDRPSLESVFLELTGRSLRD
jgi:ABC-2 type transport system ATP-binding protein